MENARQAVLSFGKHDYAAKLGPLLNTEQRKYYSVQNFKLLLMSMVSGEGEGEAVSQ